MKKAHKFFAPSLLEFFNACALFVFWLGTKFGIESEERKWYEQMMYEGKRIDEINHISCVHDMTGFTGLATGRTSRRGWKREYQGTVSASLKAWYETAKWPLTPGWQNRFRKIMKSKSF